MNDEQRKKYYAQKGYTAKGRKLTLPITDIHHQMYLQNKGRLPTPLNDRQSRIAGEKQIHNQFALNEWDNHNTRLRLAKAGILYGAGTKKKTNHPTYGRIQR